MSNPLPYASHYTSALRQWLGRPVWATVAASVGLIGIYLAAILAALFGPLPLWAGAIVCFTCAHAGASIMHEACHRTISGGARGLEWLDPLLGSVHAAMLLYDFPTFKALHLRHHVNTNDPTTDPDYWLQQHSAAAVAVRGLFVPLHYLNLYIQAARSGEIPRGAALFSAARIATLLAVMIAALIVAPVEAFVLWVLPSSVASALICVSHRMLHAAEISPDRHRTTRIIVGNAVWEWLMCPLFWLNNHHLIHHESPRLPAVAHKQLYAAIEPHLIAEGAQIVRFGARRKGGHA